MQSRTNRVVNMWRRILKADSSIANHGCVERREKERKRVRRGERRERLAGRKQNRQKGVIEIFRAIDR